MKLATFTMFAVMGCLIGTTPALSVSLTKLCQSDWGELDGAATPVLADLCEAQAAMRTVQDRLESLAEKTISMDSMQKRKNAFVRFGRSGDQIEEGSNEEIQSATKKKNEFVRFGKRKNKFVRFGKKNEENAADDVETAVKRKNAFVRFG